MTTNGQTILNSPEKKAQQESVGGTTVVRDTFSDRTTTCMDYVLES